MSEEREVTKTRELTKNDPTKKALIMWIVIVGNSCPWYTG